MRKLKHLTIKPTGYCDHNCPFCISRKQILNSRNSEISLTEWKKVFKEARDMGVFYLTISGGEPTHYEKLTELIYEAKKMGFFVSLNTNGRFLDRPLLHKIEKSGLDQIKLSLYSTNGKEHDRIRGRRGSFKYANAAAILIGKSKVRLVVHIVVNKHNYKRLSDFIAYSFDVNASSLSLNYPENDYSEKYLLLSKKDLKIFRDEILPQAIKDYHNRKKQDNIVLDRKSLLNLSGFYGNKKSAKSKFYDGVYWEKKVIHKKCNRPNVFLLIYPNGDVLPCNGSEYTHKPIVGNVRKESILGIWKGEEMQEYRKNRMDFCKYCPMMLHAGVSIATTNNLKYSSPIK